MTWHSWSIAVLLFAAAAGDGVVPTTMTCQGGKYAENGRAVPTGNSNCTRQAGSATAIAIDVQKSNYAVKDNPSCPQRDTDVIARDLARAAAAEGAATASFKEFWERFQLRAKSLGADFASLATGTSGQAGSRCQIFVVQVPVPAEKISVVEFRAHQDGSSDDPKCFQTTVRPMDKGPAALRQTAGGCSIAWSGWQSALILDGPKGATVAGVFKNWSHDRVGTGELWVWYR